MTRSSGSGSARWLAVPAVLLALAAPWARPVWASLEPVRPAVAAFERSSPKDPWGRPWVETDEQIYSLGASGEDEHGAGDDVIVAGRRGGGRVPSRLLQGLFVWSRTVCLSSALALLAGIFWLRRLLAPRQALLAEEVLVSVLLALPVAGLAAVTLHLLRGGFPDLGAAVARDLAPRLLWDAEAVVSGSLLLACFMSSRHAARTRLGQTRWSSPPGSDSDSALLRRWPRTAFEYSP